MAEWPTRNQRCLHQTPPESTTPSGGPKWEVLCSQCCTKTFWMSLRYAQITTAHNTVTQTQHQDNPKTQQGTSWYSNVPWKKSRSFGSGIFAWRCSACVYWCSWPWFWKSFPHLTVHVWGHSTRMHEHKSADWSSMCLFDGFIVTCINQRSRENETMTFVTRVKLF